ncbi:MAG: hypothetical protein AAB531_02465 [Patescibacteria group bacterium]
MRFIVAFLDWRSQHEDLSKIIETAIGGAILMGILMIVGNQTGLIGN